MINRTLTLAVAALCLCVPFVADAKNEKVLAANNDAVRYIGRTVADADGAVTFDWVGTYFETKLTGGNLAIKLSETGTSYYNVFVDGELHKVVKAHGCDTVITFVENAGKKARNLRIQKRTEGEFGKTTIKQFIMPSSGKLENANIERTRHIEFIGNSLTCGYGVEGGFNDPWSLETENCYYSFSNIIPRYFGADYTLISHSGRGAVRNYGDSVRVSAVTMKDKMMQTFDEGNNELKWDFKQGYKPDLVVINLGTNDFSLEPKPFKSEFIRCYTQILKQLREGYGDVPILCIYCCTFPAPVYDFYEDAVASMNDDKIYLFKMHDNLLRSPNDYGGVMHPNISGHQKFAQTLIPLISTITGWELSDTIIK